MTKASKPDPQKTTMLIKEAFIQETGELAGSLIINVEARRGKSIYTIPYQIAALKVPDFDIQNFMAKVRLDVDERENEKSKKIVVLDRLKGLMASPIELD